MENIPSKRLILIAITAACLLAGGAAWWLLALRAERQERQALCRHLIQAAAEEPGPASLAALGEAGPLPSFRAWLDLVRENSARPPREWTLDPRRALRALVKIHRQRSVEAVELFLPVLLDPGREMRLAALWAMERIFRDSPGAGLVSGRILPALVEAFGDADEEVREEACDCFVAVHPEWQRGLIDCLGHSRPMVRRTAIDALGGRGGEEDRRGRFPAAVLPLLEDPDHGVRTEAAVALARLERAEPRVLELLSAAIRGADPQFLASACAAVGDLGPAGAPAAPELLERLTHADPTVRRCAAGSLADVAPDLAAGSEPACAILIEALGTEDMPAVFAAQSLGKLGAAAPAAVVEALERAEGSTHAFVKDAAKNALKQIREARR